MDERTTLTEIAIVALCALLGGLGFVRFKQPPILGYILTGVLLGPSGLALIQSRQEVNMLAELGVLLLLFVVGMELSLRSFKKVWLSATLCTILQISISLVITFTLASFFKWSFGFALLLGFVISMSSTAMVVKMLDMIQENKSELGQFTIGVLIAQDLALVPMILMVKNHHLPFGDFTIIFKLIGSIGFIVLLIIYLSRRQRVRIPLMQMVSGEKELTPIASLSFCFGAAALAGLVGLSAAYGAFLAGLVLGNTHERLIMIDTIKPVQNILLMVFFLSIGLLLDVSFIIKQWSIILVLLIIITLVKTGMNVVILHALRFPWTQAFIVGAVLAQLGEFAFLLTTVAYENGIVDEYGQEIMVSLTVLSLAFSPFWLATARRLKTMVSTSFEGPVNLFRALFSREYRFLVRMLRRSKNKTANSIEDHSNDTES
jgi:CPA2 family monovalent cation:H+ antiporter-2